MKEEERKLNLRYEKYLSLRKVPYNKTSAKADHASKISSNYEGRNS
jgi:hypothetical protein